MMEAKQAFKAIRQDRRLPIYICYGNEAYLMNEFVQQLIERTVEPEEREMAIVRFDTHETPLDAILDEAETLPFLVPYKIILVRDAILFASATKEGKIEHNTERLLTYMENPMETTVIVFLIANEKLDERKKLVKKAKAQDAVVSFAPLTGEELIQWMIKRVASQGRRMVQQIAEEILRRVGTNMHALAAEIDKLALHAGEQGVITDAAVQALVPIAAEQNVFKLTEELAALRTDRVLSIYADLIKQREEPIKLLALLARQFRNMLYIKELGGQGFTPPQIAGQLGLHPYAVKVTAEQARKFSVERLGDILSDLADLDYGMKTGRIDKALGLELFLMRTGAGITAAR